MKQSLENLPIINQDNQSTEQKDFEKGLIVATENSIPIPLQVKKAAANVGAYVRSSFFFISLYLRNGQFRIIKIYQTFMSFYQRINLQLNIHLNLMNSRNVLFCI